MTRTTPNHSFTSSRGNRVTVYNSKEVGHNGTFAGFGRTVRTFAVVCGVEVECETGCSYKAASAVHAAGF